LAQYEQPVVSSALYLRHSAGTGALVGAAVGYDVGVVSSGYKVGLVGFF